MTATHEVVVTDLGRFGYRELKMAAELLAGLVKDRDVLGDEVTLAMNTMSGYVFLTDADFNVAMMNGDVIERWHDCGECGAEGFAEEFEVDENGDGHTVEGEGCELHHLDLGKCAGCDYDGYDIDDEKETDA